MASVRAVRLKAEERAPIVDQVELDVASAAIGLEVALAIGVGEILAPEQYRFVGGEEMAAHALRQSEAVFESALAQVVEKNAADAARLRAVLEEKILVAPGLEPRVVGSRRKAQARHGSFDESGSRPSSKP
jgi:hypothetical protein